MPHMHNAGGRHHIPKMLHAVTNWPPVRAGAAAARLLDERRLGASHAPVRLQFTAGNTLASAAPICRDDRYVADAVLTKVEVDRPDPLRC